MTPGPSTASRPRRRRGPLRFFLTMFLVIFVAGFYVGTRATKHIAVAGPNWLRHWWGVEGNWINFPPPAMPAPDAAPPPGPSTVTPIAPNTSAPIAPAMNTSDKPAPGELPPANNPVLPGSSPPSKQPAVPHTANLGTMVNDYNAAIRRAENTFHDYKTAMQSLNNTNQKVEILSAAQDRASVSAAEFQDVVQRAQLLYDQIHAEPQFAAKYKETDNPLDDPEVHNAFKELSVDNLRLIRPR